MHESSQPATKKSHWKLILNIVTVLLLALLVYGSRDQLSQTLSNLRHVNGWILLLLIPIEALNYHAQARLYQRLFMLVGTHFPYWYLFRTSLELNFVNHVFPSGGAAGVSYFGVTVRKGKEVSGGKATLVHVIKLAATFTSLEIIIAFGLLCLAIGNRVNGLLLLVTASLSTIVLLVTAAVPYVIGSKQRTNSLLTNSTVLINRLIHIVRPGSPETINMTAAKDAFTEFHENYQQLKSRWRELRVPFIYALLANLTEVAALYVVYVAFGKYVNIGAVIIAYSVANFAGLVSVLPGGVGIYEALMTAVMASAGVAPGVSLPVTVMYRVVNTAIQVPPGYFLYQRSLRRKNAEAASARLEASHGA
ncbi:MAG: lysylphosphatidylglycerol synthase transmembrane domain-containing protein [Patescibacteria group bacterium]|nr:lysylphosphatidylglycerol synthase transmembrane domain-containing protein [Patescibacteria group bacterium]